MTWKRFLRFHWRALMMSATALLPMLPMGAAAANLTIIYVGAKDCLPCQVYEVTDYPQWNREPAARSVRFIMVKAPLIANAFQARYWPPEARPYLKSVMFPAVPLFILIADGRIVKIVSGLGGWRNQLAPHIPGYVTGEQALP